MTVVRHAFPYAVEIVDPFWIGLKDGSRIAATLWRPKTGMKVPVVVEMIPYRRRDGTVFRDLETGGRRGPRRRQGDPPLARCPSRPARPSGRHQSGAGSRASRWHRPPG